MNYNLIFKEFGEHAVLVEWPAQIKEEILLSILSFTKKVKEQLNENDFEFIPSYNSLAIVDINRNYKPAALIKEIQNISAESAISEPLERNLWRLPVCYDTSFAPDLALICEEKGISHETLIELHTQAIYTVYCIGFLPGFMYLGGLPDALHTKRLAKPRLSVPAGSVGIGGNQTGIYPQQSPGGWNLIGNCPVKLFDVVNNPPCFVSVGDHIEFYPISKPEYDILEIRVQTGLYKPEKKA